MIPLSRFLQIPWVEGGRSFTGADCWGLVALYKKAVFGVELPAFGSARKKDMTNCFDAEVNNHKTGFANGAIACVFKGAAMVHVGVVVGEKVLHTSRGRGARLEARVKFERLGRVEYYRD